jgi:dihydrolipoamide dehydrogenase
MTDRFDVVVLGMGPGGEVAASRLLAAGKRVAVVERELIGGECAYWACIPSKTLLRPPEARAEADRAAGVARPALDWPALRGYRDWMIRHLDDADQVAGYEKRGATVVKGTGRLTGRAPDGHLQVQVPEDGRVLHAAHVIVATGSDAARPPIDGLGDVAVWTNREATTLADIPGRVLMLGGSAVAVELGQFLARMGAQVTLAERGDRLVGREEPPVGALARAALAADGVDVRLGRQARRASRHGHGVRVEFDDATTVDVDVVVLGTGRRPRVHDIGLDTVGIDVDDAAVAGRGLPVDEHCRLGEGGDGLWAVGDVTGQALFTHVAKYQGRIVADAIAGRPRRAAYQGIPRVIFADPEIAAVGLTTAQAHERGIDVTSTEVDLPAVLSRPWTYETDPRGSLGLLADRDRGVLVGAWAVAPLAGEWIHYAALAVRAAIPLDVLRDQVAQFPTYTEAYLAGLDQLDA